MEKIIGWSQLWHNLFNAFTISRHSTALLYIPLRHLLSVDLSIV